MTSSLAKLDRSLSYVYRHVTQPHVVYGCPSSYIMAHNMDVLAHSGFTWRSSKLISPAAQQLGSLQDGQLLVTKGHLTVETKL